MSHITKRLMMLIGALFAASILYASPAAAQATRTWVSGVGDDANPCSRTAPCKTFAGAISKTAAGGEINCLDPAGFGAVTVTKSITIDCTGTFGGILASSTTGVIVNGANIIVTLRGLSINGGPPSLPGINGVRVLQADRVLIERVNIFNFGGALPNGYGVIVNNTTGNPVVTIRDSSINGNSNGGILVQPAGAATASLTVINSAITTVGTVGVALSTSGGGTVLTGKIINSQITGTTPNSTGVIVKATTGSATLFISDTTISDATLTGINSNGAGAVVRLTRSSLLNNNKALNPTNSGQIISYGDNTLAGNTTDGSFTSTVPHI
jgi:hypothetical protein